LQLCHEQILDAVLFSIREVLARELRGPELFERQTIDSVYLAAPVPVEVLVVAAAAGFLAAA
jgi:hypothetical protein